MPNRLVPQIFIGPLQDMIVVWDLNFRLDSINYILTHMQMYLSLDSIDVNKFICCDSINDICLLLEFIQGGKSCNTISLYEFAFMDIMKQHSEKDILQRQGATDIIKT
ncbi:hypothetical protein ACJX0J_037193, partial [Zea mays]